MKWIPMIAAVALLTSCTGANDETKENADAATPAPTQDAENQTFTMTNDSMANPTNPVVSVDGEILRMGDLRMEANMRLSNIPGAQLTPEMMAQMKNIVTDQFITRTIMLNEAKERDLTVTDADLKEELAEIEKMIPPGVSVEEMLEQSPLGREAMLGHIKNKILIGKLTDQLAKDKVKLTEEEVDEFIKENKDDLVIPERVEARHILLLFEPQDDDKTKAEKKKKLKEIRKKIMDGADFAEMAKEHSQCGSAQEGGYLGEFDRSKMVPGFAEAAFSQKVGKVGDIVETQFGYHIIKVEGHEEAGTYPREEIEARMRDLKMQTIMQDFIAELREKADIKRF